MRNNEFEAVVYDGAIYCVECLPDGVDTDDEEVSPIFAGSEWDTAPCCEHCGWVHDYMCVLNPSEEDEEEEEEKT